MKAALFTIGLGTLILFCLLLIGSVFDSPAIAVGCYLMGLGAQASFKKGSK